jgi:hypothetical protein
MEILALNPSPKRRHKKRHKAAHKKEATTMARRRRRGSSKRGRGRSKRFSIVRVNPGEEMIMNPESRWRRARRHAGGIAEKTGISASLKKMLPMVAGAIACKLAQKKFGDGTEETGNWTLKDYLTGALGVVAVSWASKGLFKSNPKTAQHIMDGGMLILCYKLITNELVPMSDTAKQWLGQDDGTGANDEGSWTQGFSVGDLYEDDSGVTYVLGQDGYWRPADNDHRVMGGAGGVAGALVQPGPQLGEDYPFPAGIGGELVQPGPQLGNDAYARAWGTNW